MSPNLKETNIMNKFQGPGPIVFNVGPKLLKVLNPGPMVV